MTGYPLPLLPLYDTRCCLINECKTLANKKTHFVSNKAEKVIHPVFHTLRVVEWVTLLRFRFGV